MEGANEIIIVSKIKEERFCKNVAMLLFNPLLNRVIYKEVMSGLRNFWVRIVQESSNYMQIWQVSRSNLLGCYNDRHFSQLQQLEGLKSRHCRPEATSILHRVVFLCILMHQSREGAHLPHSCLTGHHSPLQVIIILPSCSPQRLIPTMLGIWALACEFWADMLSQYGLGAGLWSVKCQSVNDLEHFLTLLSFT